MEEGESVGKALAVRGQSTHCTLHSRQLRFKTAFFTFCHHIRRLLTSSLLFPPIFYSQQCKLHFKHGGKLDAQQFSENETEHEQRPAGLQQGGIYSAMHTGPSGVLWVRVCAALITGRAELRIHLAARHTQMEGRRGVLPRAQGPSLLDLDVLELFWKGVTLNSQLLSLFILHLSPGCNYSQQCASLAGKQSHSHLQMDWSGIYLCPGSQIFFFFFFFLSLWYNLSLTSRWILF